MLTLQRVVKLYHSKRLWTLTPPDKGAACRLVATAIETPTADKVPSAHTLGAIQEALNLLTD